MSWRSGRKGRCAGEWTWVNYEYDVDDDGMNWLGGISWAMYTSGVLGGLSSNNNNASNDDTTNTLNKYILAIETYKGCIPSPQV
jgi:hypothetical protein